MALWKSTLNDRGRIFTIVLIIVGVTWLGYIANRFTEAIIQGYFRDGVRLQQQRRLLEEISGHFVLCGFGRTGQQIAQELASENIPFVIIDQDEAGVEMAQNLGYVTVQGGATQDQTLLQAGMERASGIVTTLASDADNLYAVLSAKISILKSKLSFGRIAKMPLPKCSKWGQMRLFPPI